MFARLWEWIKAHPLWTAGIVLFVIVVVWFVTRPKPANSTSYSITGPDDGDAQTMAQLQMFQGQVALGKEKINAELQLGLGEISRDKYLGDLTAQLGIKNLDAQLAATMRGFTSEDNRVNQATRLALQNSKDERDIAAIASRTAHDQAAYTAINVQRQLTAATIQDQLDYKLQTQLYNLLGKKLAA